MPAPKSRLIQEENPFKPVNTAIELYKKMMGICVKMPRRYTYLILKDMLDLAGEVMDCAKKANSIFAQNDAEQQLRINYWHEARASLQALSTRINILLEVQSSLTYRDGRQTKGIKQSELEALLDLIIEEMSLLKKTLEKERGKLSA